MASQSCYLTRAQHALSDGSLTRGLCAVTGQQAYSEKSNQGAKLTEGDSLSSLLTAVGRTKANANLAGHIGLKPGRSLDGPGHPVVAVVGAAAGQSPGGKEPFVNLARWH